jgi:hypothetical protein
MDREMDRVKRKDAETDKNTHGEKEDHETETNSNPRKIRKTNGSKASQKKNRR